MQSGRASQLEEKTDDVSKAGAAVPLATRANPQVAFPGAKPLPQPAAVQFQAAAWLLSASRLFLSVLSRHTVYHFLISRNEARCSIRPMWLRLTLQAGLGPGSSTFRIARIPKTLVWSSAKNLLSPLRRSACPRAVNNPRLPSDVDTETESCCAKKASTCSKLARPVRHAPTSCQPNSRGSRKNHPGNGRWRRNSRRSLGNPQVQ